MSPFVRSCFLLLAAGALAAAAERPSITPQVATVFPHGGIRGAETTVELAGSQLDTVEAIRFVHPGIRAVIEEISFRRVRARIRVDQKVETGRHEFTVVSNRGLWFGVFWVGSQAESFEAEPNNRMDAAQKIRIPALVNGRADGADGDYYQFHAAAGQTVIFDVMATRLGSALDPVLTLFDSQGKEVCYNDDAYAFKDARLAYPFAHEGDYTLLVSASFERSGKDADYRLLATSDPYPQTALPLGAPRGVRTDVTIHGWNLESADRVWLGEDLVSGVIVERSVRTMRVRLDVPASIPVGTYQLHVSRGGVETVPVRFEISDMPELTFREGVKAKAPVVVNGLLPENGDQMKRVHWIGFDADAGKRYEFRVDGWRIGQPVDPVVSLFDAAGRMLAQEDDPAPNSFIHHPASHDPRLVFVTPETGTYRIQVRDAAYQAGGAYRLSIREVSPAFETEVRSPQTTLYLGEPSKLLVVVRRTGGVHRVEPFRKSDSEIEHFRLIEHDGWNTPIRVWLEGLPEGIVSEPVTAVPENTVFKGNDGEELFVDGTLVELPVRVAKTAKPGLYEVRAVAEGILDGRTVRCTATVLSGGIRSMRLEPTAEQKLYLNVLKPPPLFWNVPPELQISRSGHGTLKVGIVRFDGEFSVNTEAKTSVAGFRVGKATIPPQSEESEIPVESVEGDTDAPGQLILVGTFTRDGQTDRVESPPIELRVKR